MLDINEALQAIADGSYGLCKVCKAPIPKERLEALPTAVTCTEHSKEQTVSQNRPIEEDLVSPLRDNLKMKKVLRTMERMPTKT